MSVKKLLYIINVDWYFSLHWLDRAIASANAGYEVHIATNVTENRNIEVFNDLGFKLHFLPLVRRRRNPFKEIRTVLFINKIIKMVEPDVVHTITIKPNIYTGALLRSKNKPIIASVVGLGSLSFSSHSVRSRISQRLTKQAFRISFGHSRTQVLFENRDDLNEFVDNGIIQASQAVHIPGAGVDTKVFKPKPLLYSKSKKILFAARLLKDKGLFELVEAVETIRKKGVDVELMVAGIIDADAHNTIPLCQIEKWHKEGNITWLGKRDDMHNLINQAQVVCLPTRYGEGVPRILIEAAACGRAIVTSDIPGCREIVDNEVNGLLVKPGSTEELVSALLSLITCESTHNRMGAQGRVLSEKLFSSEIVISKTLDTYCKHMLDKAAG